MNQKPLIGLTPTRMPNPSGRPAFGINQPYVQSIQQAGGIPILIPLGLSTSDLLSLLDRLDGVLFTGGYDVDPRLYGKQPLPKDEGIDAERDQLESQLILSMIKASKPFFGICRGCQVINVALGGSLYQHLADQLPGAVRHDNHDHPRDYLAHPVSIERDNRLAQLIPETQAWVNSLHHQGVDQLAPELKACAHSPDGLVEAFELPGFPFGLAVQWHPEELQQNATMRGLFQSFVQACQQLNAERTSEVSL
jgi:putative glutamine amidotransferase